MAYYPRAISKRFILCKLAALLLIFAVGLLGDTQKRIQIEQVFGTGTGQTYPAYVANVYTSVPGTQVTLTISSVGSESWFVPSISSCGGYQSTTQTTITVTPPAQVYYCTGNGVPTITATAPGFATALVYLPFNPFIDEIIDLTGLSSYQATVAPYSWYGAYHEYTSTVYPNGDDPSWVYLGNDCFTAPVHTCTFTPNSAATAGQHAAYITWTDHGIDGYPDITILVEGTNLGSGLAIASSLYQAYVPQQAISSAFSATGGQPPYTWSATGLPPGINLSSAGALSGSSASSQTYQPAITVTDSAGTTVSETFTFFPPQIIFQASNQPFTVVANQFATPSTPIPAGNLIAFPGNQSVTLSAPLGDFTFATSSTASCPGISQLTMDIPRVSSLRTGAGVVYICPNAVNVGTNNYLLEVTIGGRSEVFSFPIRGVFQGGNPPPTILVTPGEIDLSQTGSIETSLQVFSSTGTATTGKIESISVNAATASGTQVSPNWVQTSPVPTACASTGCEINVSINWAGVTPQPTPGTLYAANVRFTADQGEAGNVDILFQAPSAITVSSSTSFSGTVGQGFTQTLSASGGAGVPYTWSATNLPPGLTMSSLGQISGTVQAAGTWQSTITVQDALGETLSQSASFTFASAPEACPASLSMPGQRFTSSANSGMVLVSAGNCSWSASNGGSNWVTISSGASGTGNGAVTFNGPANTTGNTRTATLTIAGQQFTVTQTASPSTPLRFVPLTPCRVVDTRSNNTGGPFIPAGQQRNFPVANNGVACSGSIPANAEAYAVNVTVVPHGPLGYVTIFPTGQSLPTVSTLNSLDGRVKANGAILPAGTNGELTVFASNDTDVVLDVAGYFVPASSSTALAFYPLAPCRVSDTRFDTFPNGLGVPSLIGQATARQFPILASNCNIPSTAEAYSLNFTVVPKEGTLGYLTAFPTGQPQPLASTLNAPTGTVVANGAIMPAGSNGDVSVYVTQDSDLVIDINGYFASPTSGGLSLYTISPYRVLDTRSTGSDQPINGTLPWAAAAYDCCLPLSAQAFIINATVVPTTALGYLTLWPTGSTQPNVSTLNSLDGSVTSNLAIVPSNAGAIAAFTSNSTHLILDVFGYFAP